MMTNRYKLTKLIWKAQENGFDEDLNIEDYLETFNNDLEFKYCFDLLFEHDFARAIWGGSGIFCTNCKTSMFVNGMIGYSECCEKWTDSQIAFWQHHLQQAVISKDPLGYFWENK